MKITLFFKFLLLFIVFFPIAVALFVVYLFYSNVQTAILISDNDYLLIQNSFTKWTFILFGLLLLLFYIRETQGFFYIRQFDCLWEKFGWKKMTIVLCSVFIISICYQFSIYTKVSVNGITYNRGYGFGSITYDWNDVDEVNVFYSVRYHKNDGNYKVNYVLKTSDGRKVNLRDSKEFWNKILFIEDEIKKRNIAIKKIKINHYVCRELLIDEKVEIEQLKSILLVEE